MENKIDNPLPSSRAAKKAAKKQANQLEKQNRAAQRRAKKEDKKALKLAMNNVFVAHKAQIKKLDNAYRQTQQEIAKTGASNDAALLEIKQKHLTDRRNANDAYYQDAKRVYTAHEKVASKNARYLFLKTFYWDHNTFPKALLIFARNQWTVFVLAFVGMAALIGVPVSILDACQSPNWSWNCQIKDIAFADTAVTIKGTNNASSEKIVFNPARATEFLTSDTYYNQKPTTAAKQGWWITAVNANDSKPLVDFYVTETNTDGTYWSDTILCGYTGSGSGGENIWVRLTLHVYTEQTYKDSSNHILKEFTTTNTLYLNHTAA